MKKKGLFVSLVLFVAICAAFSLAACKKDPPIETVPLTFSTLETNGFSASGTVSNSVDKFDFAEELIVAEQTTYSVISKNPDRNPVKDNREAALQPGNNEFSVLASRAGKAYVYNVSIYRLDMLNITFDDGEAQVQSKEENSILNEPQAAAKAGYTFDGWYVGEKKISFPYTVKSDALFTAKYTANKYTAKVDLNGGEIANKTDFDVTYDESFDIDVPTRDGYDFLGWYKGDDAVTDESGRSLTPWQFTENVTLTAKWELSEFTLTLNCSPAAAGSASGGGKLSHGSDVTLSATANLGYDFIGWYDGETKVSSDLAYTFVMPKRETALTAKFEVKAEMAPYEFTSTADTCTITKLKDKQATEAVIPDYVTAIGKEAFSYATLIEEIVVPASVEVISESAFDTNSLRKLTLNEGLKKIGTRAFKNSLYLTEIVLPDSVTEIGEESFWQCQDVTALTLGEGLKKIGRGSFDRCSQLATLYWNATALESTSGHAYQSYGGNLFSDTVLSAIIFGDNVTSIPEYIGGHKNVKKIFIPKSVTNIESYAFHHMTDATIYCEAESKPEGFEFYWNYNTSTVVKYGCKREDVEGISQ